MAYSTLRFNGVLDDARRDAVDEIVRSSAGSVLWRASERAKRTYGLLEVPDRYDHAAIRTASGAVVYDKPIIALALFPSLAQALPAVLEALGGSGRPAGVLTCAGCDGGAIVEWDPQITAAPVILALADVELRRFSSGRTAELLSPLPPALVAAIAATGLRAPEIAPKRILELRIDGA